MHCFFSQPARTDMNHFAMSTDVKQTRRMHSLGRKPTNRHSLACSVTHLTSESAMLVVDPYPKSSFSSFTRLRIHSSVGLICGSDGPTCPACSWGSFHEPSCRFRLLPVSAHTSQFRNLHKQEKCASSSMLSDLAHVVCLVDRIHVRVVEGQHDTPVVDAVSGFGSENEPILNVSIIVERAEYFCQ